MQYKNEKSLHLRKIIGKIVKKLRIENTQKSMNKLAAEFDLNNGNLNKIENAKIDCKVVTLWKIAEAVGLKFSELVKYIEDELGEDFKLIDE